MLTNEVAKQAGVNIETLRFYERKGLLKAPKRLSSGYRMYDTEAVRTVRFIKQAQNLGFTLTEIKTLLGLSTHTLTSCNSVQSLASQKIGEVDAKIRDLQAMKVALDELLSTCYTRDHKQGCPLLNSIK